MNWDRSISTQEGGDFELIWKFVNRYEDVRSKMDEWRAQSSTSRVYDSGNTYRRLQRALRDPEANFNSRPPSPAPRREQYELTSRAKDITIYKPKELRLVDHQSETFCSGVHHY